DLGHEWSSGYDGYTPEETQKKLDQWRSKAEGPTTCARFAALNPAGCQGCPHQGKITSPIVLGRRSHTSVQPENAAVRTNEQIKLPEGFQWYGDQLMAVNE